MRRAVVWHGRRSGLWFWEIHEPYMGGPGYTVTVLGDRPTQHEAMTAAANHLKQHHTNREDFS